MSSYCSSPCCRPRSPVLNSLLTLLLVTALVQALPLHPASASTINKDFGFDACTAPSVSTMSTWIANSSYRSIGIYIGGINRGCDQPLLNADWVPTVVSQGWAVAPLYVGLQAPCAAQPLAKMSSTPSVADSQGATAADDAVAAAGPLRLTVQSPIYLDMEGYPATAGSSCANAVNAFITGWSRRLHERGYVAGVYGSSASTGANLAAVYNASGYVIPDDLWFANYNTGAVLTDPYIPASTWTNHQRMHQYTNSHDEQHGGVTLTIDNDINDGATYFGGSGPGVSSWGPSRLDVFVRGADNRLYHKYYDGSWHPWEGPPVIPQPPVAMMSDPAAVSWGSGRIDILVRGFDSAVYHLFYDNGWGAWESLGGVTTSGPGVSSWGNGRLDVFAKGTDSRLYHAFYNGSGWSGWESSPTIPQSPSTMNSDPAAVSWGLGRIDVFVRGTDSAMWHLYYDGSWGAWESLGGVFRSGPGASSWGVGRIDVFGRGTDLRLYHGWYDGSWHTYESSPSLPGPPSTMDSDPGAVSWAGGRIDVFLRGADAQIAHEYFDAAWGSWEILSGVLAA